MPPNTAVRGLRRAELLTHDPAEAIRFHRSLLDWTVLQADSGFDCWVGERRCATVRAPRAGEPLGWRLVFAGAAQNSVLTGPDDTSAGMATGRAQHGPWAPSPRRGEPCWIELFTSDAERADSFWTDTLAWTAQEHSDRCVYVIEGRPVASRVPRARLDGRAGWSCVFTVESLTRAVDQVDELGGRIVERSEHPVLGEVIVVADGQDAVYALAGKVESWGG